MARRGDWISVVQSIEATYTGHNNEYKELVIRVTFEVMHESSKGFFNHVTGAAEPPSGPELEVVGWEIAEDDPGKPLHEFAWKGVDENTLRLIFGKDWTDTILARCEEEAAEEVR